MIFQINREENNTDLLVTEVSRLGRSVKIIVNTVDELTKAGQYGIQ